MPSVQIDITKVKDIDETKLLDIIQERFDKTGLSSGSSIKMTSSQAREIFDYFNVQKIVGGFVYVSPFGELQAFVVPEYLLENQ